MEIKFRLLLWGKIVGYERHRYADGKGCMVAIMHSSDGIDWANIHLVPEVYIDHDEKHQYAGLEDVSGVEIYKGDMLGHYGTNPCPCGRVEFYNGGFCAFWDGGSPERLYKNLTRHFKVIDDTPENHKLME